MNEQLKKEILGKIDIVEYVQQFLNLERKGKNFIALCPFHNDNHPSMSVSAEKQIFKCFTCGTGGDVITFIYKYNQLTNPQYTYRDALIEAAKYANVEVDLAATNEKVIDPELKKITAINNEVCKIYRHFLNTEIGSRSKDYLVKDRGFTERTITEFEIGYAPNKNILKEALLKLNYTEADLMQAGVINTNGNDCFRNRIIFPIKNARGSIVGFSGRALPGTNENIKYLNTGETLAFTKGNQFFNLDKSRNIAIKSKKLYIVEGYTDAISLYQAGIKNVVTQMGTALTLEQIKMLKNLSVYNGVQVSYIGDSDLPGKKAVIKNAELLEKEKISTKIVDLTIPGQKKVDPDLLIKENPALFQEKLNNSKSVLSYKMDFYFEQQNRNGYFNREEYVKKVLPAISKTPPIEQVQLLSKCAEQTGFSIDTLKDQMNYDNLTLQVDRVLPKQQGEKPKYKSDYYTKQTAVKSKQQFLTNEIEVQNRKEFKKDLAILTADENTILLYEQQCISQYALKLKYAEMHGACLQFTTTILFDDKEDIKFYQDIRNKVVDTFAEEFGMDKSNIECVAAVHHNTKCAHIHFNIWQKKPIKRIVSASSLEKKINISLNKQLRISQQMTQSVGREIKI